MSGPGPTIDRAAVDGVIREARSARRAAFQSNFDPSSVGSPQPRFAPDGTFPSVVYLSPGASHSSGSGDDDTMTASESGYTLSSTAETPNTSISSGSHRPPSLPPPSLPPRSIPLPCEMSLLHLCTETFDNFDEWFEHLAEFHLNDNLPSSSMCWYCDLAWVATERNDGNRRHSLRSRMHHILHAHLEVGDGDADSMRPDFALFHHMRRQRLIDEAAYRQACALREHGFGRDLQLQNADWRPAEFHAQQELASRVEHDQAHEDRHRRRCRRG